MFRRNPLEPSGKRAIIGEGMTPNETRVFFASLGKRVICFFGYSEDYENQKAMHNIATDVLAQYSPETSLVNAGATRGGIGGVYPIAKAMGFLTTGIVSSRVIEYMDEISDAVDYVCIVSDTMWGGKLPKSNVLSPTSQAMVACSDVLVGIGGGEISRDEMVAGSEQGKPVYFYPAEISHERMIGRARRMGLPTPESFWGAAHEVFRGKHY
jgi:hypothetical protein